MTKTTPAPEDQPIFLVAVSVDGMSRLLVPASETVARALLGGHAQLNVEDALDDVDQDECSYRPASLQETVDWLQAYKSLKAGDWNRGWTM